MARRAGSRPSREAVTEALSALAATDVAEFLSRQRWFGGKGRRVSSVALGDAGPLDERARGLWLTLVEVSFSAGPPETFALPLALRPDVLPDARLVGRLGIGTPQLLAYDAFDDVGACRTLLDLFRRSASVGTGRGQVRFTRIAELPRRVAGRASLRRLTAEQSNTSVVYDETLILKAFRKVEAGVNPDRELTAFLATRTGFRNTAPLVGAMDYAGPHGVVATLAILQRFEPSEGDGWAFALERLAEFYESVRERPEASAGRADRAARIARERSGVFLEAIHRLGALTGALHAALASDAADPDFAPEAISRDDVAGWTTNLLQEIDATLAALRHRARTLPDSLRRQARAVLDGRADLARRVRGLGGLARAGCVKTRIHGDYHLGQTLRTGGDFLIIDFEGEPARSLAERRAKQCPLRDVAGMLRSFDYAAAAALREREKGERRVARLEAWAEVWRQLAADAFLKGYEAEARRAAAPLLPASRPTMAAVLAVYEMEKALYELRYEIDNRPAWLPIPLRGLTRLLARPRR